MRYRAFVREDMGMDDATSMAFMGWPLSQLAPESASWLFPHRTHREAAGSRLASSRLIQQSRDLFQRPEVIGDPAAIAGVRG